MSEPRPDDPIPNWVETVTKIAGAIGFNKVRVRWKLVRWVNEGRRDKNRAVQKSVHVGYEHRVCPHCGAINDKGEALCARCGKKLGARSLEILGRLGVHAPRAISVATLLGVIIAAIHTRLVLSYGGGFSVPVEALIDHGGSLPPQWSQGEWWRPVTSTLLHADLLHVAFNLFSLASIGAVADDRFGRGVSLAIFVVTGTFAAIASQMLSPGGVGIGASGAVLGLIGAVAAQAHRMGQPGRAVRDDMLKWVFYIFVFGFAVGADNTAHAAGMLLGAAFGYGVPARALTRASRRPLQVIVGAVSLAVIAAATVAVMVPLQQRQSARWIFDEIVGDDGVYRYEYLNQPAAPRWDADDPYDVANMVRLCEGEPTAEDYERADGDKASICAFLGRLREDCKDHVSEPLAPGEVMLKDPCSELKRLDGAPPPVK